MQNENLSFQAVKIKSFTDLIVWRKGHAVVIKIYTITKNFPREEMFGITNQLRRAIVSFTSNIAEGFTRSSSKDKVHFYIMALSSLTEIQNQLLIARDIAYISSETFTEIANQTVELSKMTNGLIRTTKLMIR